jgi:hypothetical protein
MTEKDFQTKAKQLYNDCYRMEQAVQNMLTHQRIFVVNKQLDENDAADIIRTLDTLSSLLAQYAYPLGTEVGL